MTPVKLVFEVATHDVDASFIYADMSWYDIRIFRDILAEQDRGFCTVCKLIRSRTKFHPAKNKTGMVYRCSDCALLLTSQWRRIRTTGWSIEEYNRAFEEQEGLCLICRKPESRENRVLSADHSHTTQTKRGLLCSNCNLGLGNFKDSPEALRAAADYIEGK